MKHNFEEGVESSTDTDESDSSNSGSHSIKYYKWITINGKASKVMVSLPLSEVFVNCKGEDERVKVSSIFQK